MKQLGIVCGIMLAVSILLGLEVWGMGAGDVRVLGMRAVSSGFEKPPDPSWLAFGGIGVLALGAGFGIVEFGIYGGGLFFASGQLTVGLVSVGQFSIGLIAVVAQFGLGATSFGQFAFGLLAKGQMKVGFDGTEFMQGLNEDLGRFLSFR